MFVTLFKKGGTMGKDKSSSAGKFAIGAAVGAVVGVVAGLLTAPKSGKETRADIAKKVDETKDFADKKVDEAKKHAKKMFGRSAKAEKKTGQGPMIKGEEKDDEARE